MTPGESLPCISRLRQRHVCSQVLYTTSDAGWLTEPRDGFGMLAYRATKAGQHGTMVGLHELYGKPIEEDTWKVRAGDKNKVIPRIAAVHPGVVAVRCLLACACGGATPLNEGPSHATCWCSRRRLWVMRLPEEQMCPTSKLLWPARPPLAPSRCRKVQTRCCGLSVPRTVLSRAASTTTCVTCTPSR